MTSEEKFAALERRIRELGRAAIAFSGGADSSLLAYIAHSAIGTRASAVTVWSPLLSEADRNELTAFTEKYGIALIKIDFNETSSADFCANTPERCYICKRIRLKLMEACAAAHAIPWLLDGSNADDISDFRPGMRALKESSRTLSPMLELGITKAEIRSMSRALGLPTADKPAAACLASRVKSGVRITPEMLAAIDSGEAVLRTYVPREKQLRLRFDGETAKIETEPDIIPRIENCFDDIKTKLAAIGFAKVQIDRGGYKMGNANGAER